MLNLSENHKRCSTVKIFWKMFASLCIRDVFVNLGIKTIILNIYYTY